jgi:hypothetical protein
MRNPAVKQRREQETGDEDEDEGEDDGRHEDEKDGRAEMTRTGEARREAQGGRQERGRGGGGARSLLPSEHVVEVERVGTCGWSLRLQEPAVRNRRGGGSG